MLHRRDLSRTFSAIRREGYDDELVAKMVSGGAASSIRPHSGILISSFSGTDSTASQALSSASGMDPANVATPISPEPRSLTTLGRVSVTYWVASAPCSARRA